MTAVASEPVRRFYKVKDIATILGISHRAALRLIGDDLPAVRCGSSLRIAADDFDRFIEKQRATGKAGTR